MYAGSSSREYPLRPVPGVGAVVLRTVDGELQVLLVQRANPPSAGTWSLPGGAIELGETAAEACVREVAEETGLAVDVLDTVETFDIILKDDAGGVQFHYLIVDMLCTVAGGSLAPGADASQALWASADAVLERGLFALTPRACTVVRKAISMAATRT